MIMCSMVLLFQYSFYTSSPILATGMDSREVHNLKKYGAKYGHIERGRVV